MRTYTKRGVTKTKSESWQVIYMDLMTIIMVFFVILWSLNQGKDEGISETVGDHTARKVTLPGDVLFKGGKSLLSKEGKEVFAKLFKDSSGQVLNFETSGLVKRLLVIHGHTDSLGNKDKNIVLGFDRAMTTYKEIKKYSKDIPDHVVICSHADNNTVQDIPPFKGKLTNAQRIALRGARAKNRRIEIEDKIVNKFKDQ